MRLGAGSRIWVFACVLAVAASVSAESPWDPGPGKDASNLQAAPTPLPGPGAYTGILPAADADWYLLNTTAAPRCTELASSSTAGHEVTLETRGTFVHSITTLVPPGGQARLVLAGPATQRAIAGIVATGESGTYDFKLRSHTLADLGSVDTGTSGDASSFLQNAAPVGAGCIRGTVGVKDTTDVFAFTVYGPDQIVYSLGTTGASSPRVSLLDGTGAVLGAIASGEIASVHLPAAGTYYLSSTVPLDASLSEYAIGLVGPDPPGSPCRPHCRVS